MAKSLWMRSSAVSLLILLVLLFTWQVATLPKATSTQGMSAEYAAMMGAAAPKAGMPGPADIGKTVLEKLADPFYDQGLNDKGIGIQIGYSLARVLAGFFLAAAVAIPLGFVIGMSPVMRGVLDPFIQVLNLSLNNVIFAILPIGIVGMILDLRFGWVSRLVAYRE